MRWESAFGGLCGNIGRKIHINLASLMTRYHMAGNTMTLRFNVRIGQLLHLVVD